MSDARTFSSPLDLQSVRADFPILSRELAGGRIVKSGGRELALQLEEKGYEEARGGHAAAGAR